MLQKTAQLKPIELPPLTDTPLVSVLVPNYNYARYIGEALDSVLEQSYPHFEVIVCDDGSKDNSCEIIADYVRKDSRIKLICKENGGVANALNVAYSQSKGQVICILDADDIWMNNKLEKVLELYTSDPKCGFAIHNVIEIDAQGNLIKTTPKYNHLASGWMGQAALENGGFVYNIPPASALSIRKEIGEKIFPLNEAFTRNADSLIFGFAPFITVIGNTLEVLSKFRLHGANTTSQTTLTLDRMEREQITFERIYQEQKKFLHNIYGEEIAKSLTDIKHSLVVCHDLYLIGRLKGIPKVELAEMYQRFTTHTEFNKRSTSEKLLFQWGEYLPDVIFKMCFDQVYGASRLKHLVKLLIKR
ncbi:MAG: glycosyltransferase family 2 protein [Nostocales cyanobacterium 94392]|nr:glycosyltransferase family 2 protein [Nostocales cyanobacterium 94392]